MQGNDLTLDMKKQKKNDGNDAVEMGATTISKSMCHTNKNAKNATLAKEAAEAGAVHGHLPEHNTTGITAGSN